MSTTTSNLGLTMPALTDVADITVINNNMTLIDTAIEANDTAIASINTSISATNTNVGLKANESDLALTNQNVSTNTASIATINGEITTINNNITTTNTNVTSNTNAINTLNTEVTTITQNTTNNTTNITAVSNNLASHSADDTRHENYVLDTSTTANTCTGTCATYTAYTDGSNITLKVKNTNTGATTINVNGLGAKPIKDALGNASNAGTLIANNIYFLVYEVTYGGFILANCIQTPTANGNTSGTVSIASPVTSPVVPVRMASCSDTKITSTSATTILTCTPTVQGNFEVNLYLGITSSTTPVTITITWTDGRGAQTYTMFNAYPFTADAHSIAPYFINAVANQPIIVTMTAGTANQVYVSGAIRGI